MNRDGRARRMARRAGLGVLFVIAAVAPPLIVGSIGMRATVSTIFRGAAAPPAGALPEVPAHDAAKKTAIVLLGDSLTEATDFLVPFELLGESGEYNVYAVARARRPLRLFPGDIDVLPHLSYADYHARIGALPDIVVVPYMEGDTEDAVAARGEFLRGVWTRENLLLTICGGSYSVARTGLLDGRRATSHQNVLRLVRQQDTGVDWVDGARYIDDGNVVSSAGITSGFDATLYLLGREHGREAALRVAAQVGYPHTGYLDDPSFSLPETRYTTTMLSMAYARPRRMAVALYDGASEIALASLTDTYPRSFAATLTPIAPERGYVTTRGGLHVIPRERFAGMGRIDRLFVAGEPTSAERAELRAWAASERVRPEPWGVQGEFVYDTALRDLARSQSRGAATNAARGLEYPIEHLALAGAAPPVGLMARPLGLALMGIIAFGLLRVLWSRRRRGPT